MRPGPHIIMGMILVNCLIPRLWTQACLAQVSAKASQPVAAALRADEVHEKALALHAVPNRAFDAAQLHLQAVALRAANDSKAIDDLALAAHMFGYAKRPLDAKRTMERAADRALSIGDVVRAAQALVDATFMADEQRNRSEVNRLGRKALLLAESPLLNADQRLTITERIAKNPRVAAAIR